MGVIWMEPRSLLSSLTCLCHVLHHLLADALVLQQGTDILKLMGSVVAMVDLDDDARTLDPEAVRVIEVGVPVPVVVLVLAAVLEVLPVDMDVEGQEGMLPRHIETTVVVHPQVLQRVDVDLHLEAAEEEEEEDIVEVEVGPDHLFDAALVV